MKPEKIFDATAEDILWTVDTNPTSGSRSSASTTWISNGVLTMS